MTAAEKERAQLRYGSVIVIHRGTGVEFIPQTPMN